MKSQIRKIRDENKNNNNEVLQISNFGCQCRTQQELPWTTCAASQMTIPALLWRSPTTPAAAPPSPPPRPGCCFLRRKPGLTPAHPPAVASTPQPRPSPPALHLVVPIAWDLLLRGHRAHNQGWLGIPKNAVGGGWGGSDLPVKPCPQPVRPGRSRHPGHGRHGSRCGSVGAGSAKTG